MRRATVVLAAGTWPAHTAAGAVTLAWEDRHRRRIRLTDDAGEPFVLDLERAAVLADGDGLVLEEAGVLRVRAAPESVLDVACATPAEAARIAWHLGNRHAPVQVLADGTVRLREDHVFDDMLRRLGVRPVRRAAPFEPEPGAYADGAGQGRAHGH